MFYERVDVLVTGANGFIGSHAMRDLTCAGLSVAAGTRGGRDGSRRIDMHDPSCLRPALDGVGAVVHCVGGDRAATIEGTRALLHAAAAAGVGRVVYLSSMSVYGAAQGRVTEETPSVSPNGNDYAAAKTAAEQVCLEQTGVDVVRLRPTIVYGPRSKWWLDEMARRIRSGRWRHFGVAGEGTCNPVYVSDVVGAIVAALQTPAAAGRVFNVNGPETTTWNDWFTRLARVIGAPVPRGIGPGALRSRTYAAVPVRALARLRPQLAANWLTGVPGRSELALYANHVVYATDAARTGMGWVPSVTIDAGLANSAAWLQGERAVV